MTHAVHFYTTNDFNFWVIILTTTIFKIGIAWNIKGIKNDSPWIVEIRGTQGCALVGDPARAVGECRDVAKAQP